MKKIILFKILVLMVITSCTRDPFADFSVSSFEIEIGGIIYFTNYSMDADYYEWDFGDGYISYAYNPSHIYTVSGTFTVTLTAFSGSRACDRAYMTIRVLPPTSLEIIVLEYYDEYAVPDASVILYNTLDDWWDEVYPVEERFTDRDGIVFFPELYPQRYYVDVWEEYHNNWVLAEEDVGWIETDWLIPNEVNYFIAWVDYFESVKKSDGRPEKNIRILKLEQVDKRTHEQKLESTKKYLEGRKTANENKVEK